MIPSAARAATPTTDTYGLPPESCPHLIAKLRNMSPEQRATIIHTNQDTK